MERIVGELTNYRSLIKQLNEEGYDNNENNLFVCKQENGDHKRVVRILKNYKEVEARLAEYGEKIDFKLYSDNYIYDY